MRNLLPHFIAGQYERRNYEGRFKATALFVDVSGFTPITEALARHGSEGAETLSTVLNRVFAPMIEAVYRNGGFISTFAGDAFTAIFPYQQSVEAVVEEALPALRTAERIRSIFRKQGRQRTKFGRFVLAVRTGISAGDVDWGIVGSQPRAFFFRGDALHRAADATYRAGSGQLVVDNSVAPGLSGKLESAGDGFYYVHEFGQLDATTVQPAKRSPLKKNIAEEFLPQAILNLRHYGEYRDVASVFISFQGAATYAEIDAFASAVLDRAREFNGFVKELEFTDGSVVPCFFGAPVAYEDNLDRAVGFVLALQNDLSGRAELHGITIRAGITSGRVFAGITGAPPRSQYALMGSSINLAARMMARAEWGEVLIGESVARHSSAHARGVGDLSYKGIEHPVATYQLLEKASTQERRFAESMVGRRRELRQLVTFAQPIFEKEFAGVAYIYGEPGIGKSQLAYALRQNLEKEQPVSWFSCSSDEILRKPFNPFISFLSRHFDQTPDRSAVENRTMFERRVDSLIAGIAGVSGFDEIIRELDRTRSVLGALLGLRWEGSLYENLDAKGRYENTCTALKMLLLAESAIQPLVIEIEDGQWLDSDSISFVQQLVRLIDSYPILLVVTARYNDDGTAPRIELEDTLQLDLRLKNLSPEELRLYAAAQLSGDVSEELYELLLEKTKGNPFFASQMIAYFREHDMLISTPEGWAYVPDKSDHIAVPENISAVLIARIDRLTHRVKEVVKAASVIGMEFDLELLAEVLRNDVSGAVKEAEDHGIWRELHELCYIFRHALLRDAAYQMQLHARRRHVHHLIAESLERLYGKNLGERFADVAYHYERAEMFELAIEYLKKAGDHAKEHYRNDQAIALYDRALEHLKSAMNRVDDLHIGILMNQGSVLELVGTWDRAAQAYQAALDVAESTGERNLLIAPYNASGIIAYLEGDYVRAMQQFEHALELAVEFDDVQGIAMTLGHMGNVYSDRREYDLALECYVRQLSISEQQSDHGSIARAVGNMGMVYGSRGEYDLALKCFQRHLSISESMGEPRDVSIAFANIGNVYLNLGEYDHALECFKRFYTISEEMGERRSVSRAVGSISSVYLSIGDNDRALDYLQRWLAMSEELDDQQSISHAIGNMGIIYHNRGEYDLALACYQRKLSISETTGDRGGVSLALGNMALIYHNRGEYELALGCYQQQCSVCERLGDRQGVYLATGSMGIAYANRSEYERALECFEQALQGHRNLGFHYGMINSLMGRSHLLVEMLELELMPIYFPQYVPRAMPGTWRTMALRRARNDAEECLTISRQLRKFDSLFSSQVLLARIDAAEGKSAAAVERLNQVLHHSSDEVQQAESHYWLWKLMQTSTGSPGSLQPHNGNTPEISRGEPAERHRLEALRYYQSMYANNAKHEYGVRIEELMASAPSSTQESINATE